MRASRCIHLLFAVALTACSQKSPIAQDVSALASASVIAPSDPRLAALYQQSCKTCHSIPNGAAPLVGDRAQWDARWGKGMATLTKNVITGLNGMPPGGQCFACTAADFEALTRFLAGREGE